MWRCQMCNITLEDACRQFFPSLYSITTISDNNYFQRKRDSYVWERTQKHPKVTCGWDCGQNYKAWRRTGEPKGSFYAAKCQCDCCGEASTRGRIIKQRRGKRYCDFHLCIDCWRKKEIREGRRLWEILNKPHRNQYAKSWRTSNPEKYKAYKAKYRKKVSEGKPRLGNCRKPICAVAPHLFL
jgi:hypothetical protein